MVDGVKFNGATGAQFGKNNAKNDAKVSGYTQGDSAKFMKLVASGRVSRPIGKISTTARTVRQLDRDTSANPPRSLHDTIYSAAAQLDNNNNTPLTERSVRIISSDELQDHLPNILEK